MTELSKFDELRIKTERQLVQLINNELDRGIRDVRQALRSADTWAIAGEWYVRAKRECALASRLIPLTAEDDRRGCRTLFSLRPS